MRPLSVEPFLKETIKLQQISMPENIALQADIHGADMLMKGDINQLQQVLMNLINNAVVRCRRVKARPYAFSLINFMPTGISRLSTRELMKGNTPAYGGR